MNLRLRRIYVVNRGDHTEVFEVPEGWFLLDVEWDVEVAVVTLYQHALIDDTEIGTWTEQFDDTEIGS